MSSSNGQNNGQKTMSFCGMVFRMHQQGMIKVQASAKAHGTSLEEVLASDPAASKICKQIKEFQYFARYEHQVYQLTARINDFVRLEGVNDGPRQYEINRTAEYANPAAFKPSGQNSGSSSPHMTSNAGAKYETIIKPDTGSKEDKPYRDTHDMTDPRSVVFWMHCPWNH